MRTTRVVRAGLGLAALVAAVLATPFASEAKKHGHVSRHVPTVVSTVQPGAQPSAYATSGVSAAQPRTYGTSGRPIGTVTAPSVGSYYWPSVGVTNAVPTWSNTGPR
jgi:hypothetical protein